MFREDDPYQPSALADQGGAFSPLPAGARPAGDRHSYLFATFASAEGRRWARSWQARMAGAVAVVRSQGTMPSLGRRDR